MATSILQAFEAARDRMLHAPGELTDSDIQTLGEVDSGLIVKARVARTRALYPGVPMEGTWRPPVQPAVQKAPSTPEPSTFSDLIEAHKGEPASYVALGAAVDVLMDALKHAAKRIDSLEQAQQKTGSGVHWRGTFQAGETYKEGELTTHAGSLWLAQRRTSQTPGRPPTGTPADFVMIVKSGQAAR